MAHHALLGFRRCTVEEAGIGWISFRQDLRLLPGDAGRRRQRRHRRLVVRPRSGLGEIRIAWRRRQQLISQQHREIFMDRVVTVIDVGAAELAKADLEFDAAIGPQPPHILSDEQFGRRDRAGTAIYRDAFLEVKMDRVIPTAAAIDQRPVLDFARLRYQCRYPVGVERVRRLSVDLDRPGELLDIAAFRYALITGIVARVSVTGSSELDDALPDGCDDRDLRGQRLATGTPIGVTEVHARIRGLCGVGRARVVDALEGVDDPELQDRPDAWIALSFQSFRYRDRAVRLTAVRLLQEVQQVNAVSRPECREVDDNIVAFGNTLLFQLCELNGAD